MKKITLIIFVFVCIFVSCFIFKQNLRNGFYNLYKIAPGPFHHFSYFNNETYSPNAYLDIMGGTLNIFSNQLPKTQIEYDMFEKNMTHFRTFMDNSKTRFKRHYYYKTNFYKLHIVLDETLPILYVDTYNIKPQMNFTNEQNRIDAALKMINILKTYKVNSITRYWDIKYKLGILKCIGHTKASQEYLLERMYDPNENRGVKEIIQGVFIGYQLTNTLNNSSFEGF